ncbi:type I DNA topoisomerase [Anaplasma phagocytophilum]|uniref:DNA topoisomerase 1 n=1 Tax=Anaplasma phagocytophilum TaxID=948 RepID=A0A098EFI4_ANAPH|nr:type I DNA topoisomerase [Anaplasma phagocytophilum]CEG21028.1 DNA topoisomerase [Anaplasma phagocytophilum]SBO32916.1 DNA topoisomerase 1 [Anaplasma phagocytophilum]SBO33082.1 DNA topoisomerase 1 [Anaplasma phagocytophilum]SBO33489.1 DNA topoisomerase 1 [Anaplasma phagocytophilum]SCV64979.1 DNA topoisomerase 1 [Anaplasma phagocytophilum]
MGVVIVESPSKAKTISKYLGKKFNVIASFGHIRDFPAKSGSVDPSNDFKMIYEIIPKSEKHLDKIVKTVSAEKEAIYLATDPDREGEAIAWHIVEVLKEKCAIAKDVTVNRMVFNEVTKRAVTAAVDNCRPINMDLVRAQQTRRVLDYLVGFTLSPLLWRKLPGSRSAGRVQSVALRLLCEREYEVEQFKTQEYWDVGVDLQNQGGEKFEAVLKCYAGEKLEKFSIGTEEQAKEYAETVKNQSYTVESVESKKTKRNPYPPFITSSLQQEASTKLGFSAKNTMMIAQKLYEGIDIGGEIVGLITYMRTDGFYISEDAVNYIRDTIKMQFGEKYLSKSVRNYTKKVKNAQEAHEAIRPTDITMLPEQLSKYLTDEQLKLYTLIWKRTLATQMESAVIDQVAVDIKSSCGKISLHATGSTLSFDGYYRVYGSEDSDKRRMLPQLREGESCELLEVHPNQHFTQPPARYSEASLVKKMEEIGIGRPSTYATIISVLQERGYTQLEQKRFIPSERGRIVNAFLTNFFRKYVEYDFTANLEEELDLISNGKMVWKEVLSQFWDKFISDVSSVKTIEASEILKAITRDLENYAFSSVDGESISRVCPQCGSGELMLNIGKTSAFLGCNRYPECRYTRGIGGDGGASPADDASRILGIDEETQEEIFLKRGPYGEYLQLGNSTKRVSLTKSAGEITVDLAKKMLSLPLVLGCYPDTDKEIKLGIGRFGPYLFYNGMYFSIKDREDYINISHQEAVEIIDKQSDKKAKLLGQNKDGKDIYVCKGRYGFYLKCDKTSVALKGRSEDITLEDAILLLSQKQ